MPSSPSVAAWRDGFRRVAAVPSIVVSVFLITLLAALPLAIAMRGMIETHLGRSLRSEQVADGVDGDWWQEFTFQSVRTRPPRSLRRSSDSPQRSTASAACSTAGGRRSRWQARLRSISSCGCSCPEASSIATRGNGPPTRTASSPPPACSSGGSCAWPSWRRSSTGSCSPTCIRGSSTCSTHG